MKSALRFLAFGLLLFLPLSAAHAQVSVSPITDQTVNAGGTITVNVVAVDPNGAAITVTASLPAFATLNQPTTGTGIVVTTLVLTPAEADVGTHVGTVTATAGDQSDTETFQITVAAAASNQPPRVTAPATMTVAEGTLLTFQVTASDADADPITGLSATNLPTGASFTASAPYTSGTFNWTPDLKQAGHYDVIFAASNAQSDSAATHISVTQSDLGPVSLAPIDDVTMAEGETVTVDVIAADPDEEIITVSASLPSFATLNPPTESSATDTLATTITIAPGAGTAGTYGATVTATSAEDTATEPFTIEVTGGALEATASLIGAFNFHKKFICFKVKPVEESFDLLAVSLSSITLSFGGDSISTVRPTHLAFDCDEGDDDGEHDGDDGDDDDGGDCDDCGGDRNGDDDAGQLLAEDCVPSHIMACFSMADIRALFEGQSLPGILVDATIEGELTTGETFVATIGGKHVAGPAHGDKGGLSLRIKPNPMNPNAAISFTLTRPGPVRVAIYDLAGRLVKTVRDGNFAAGNHVIPWDGSTRSGGRAASGIYFVTVETRDVKEVGRVAVLK